MIRWALRRTIIAAGAVAGAAWLAAPVAAQVAAQAADATVYTMTPERIAASTAAIVGLIGLVIGGRALARSTDRTGRRGATIALVLGPIGFIIGGLVVATADGGLGTGNGLGGGVVAMIVGLTGTALGALALTRSRRAG